MHQGSGDSTLDLPLMDIISVIATVINVIAAVLIAIQIKKFRQRLQTDGLGPSSPYTTLMEIWVESAALIILFSIVYLVLAGFTPVSFIFMQCLVHINVRVHNLLLLVGRTGNLTLV